MEGRRHRGIASAAGHVDRVGLPFCAFTGEVRLDRETIKRSTWRRRTSASSVGGGHPGDVGFYLGGMDTNMIANTAWIDRIPASLFNIPLRRTAMRILYASIFAILSSNANATCSVLMLDSTDKTAQNQVYTFTP